MNNSGLTWERFLEALTDENKAFNFPIKYPALEFDKSTKDIILLSAGLIASGMIISAMLKK